ncbi:hypothetical protein [Flavobacterium sp.]|uniref:hypothetical protein n=1 Tax=Flavobacterium sp. TaxID=239 RepID=UPI003752B9CE
MKKITLLVASILLVGSVAKASDVLTIADERTTTRFSLDEPISFTERGIDFFVFANGDFDFNTRPNDSQGEYFFKSAGKRGSDSRRDNRPTNFGTMIEHDSFGRVRRVGNTFINYDNNDRVNRIGTVYMRYNRFALTQIGGLQIIYNRRGDIVDMFGSVKGRRNYGFTQNYYGNNQDYDNDDNHNNNYSQNYNNDSYYYKADGSKAKIEDDKKEENRKENK